MTDIKSIFSQKNGENNVSSEDSVTCMTYLSSSLTTKISNNGVPGDAVTNCL